MGRPRAREHLEGGVSESTEPVRRAQVTKAVTHSLRRTHAPTVRVLMLSRSVPMPSKALHKPDSGSCLSLSLTVQSARLAPLRRCSFVFRRQLVSRSGLRFERQVTTNLALAVNGRDQTCAEDRRTSKKRRRVSEKSQSLKQNQCHPKNLKKPKTINRVQVQVQVQVK